MRTKFSGILTLLLAFVVQLTFAQEKTISGTVSDNSGMPLPGVNIIVKNTSNGTQSDFDGIFSVNVNVGQTLVFSYVGFVTVEQTVTASTRTMSLRMNEDDNVLEEVVVTALGIKKEKKALGYAVSSIKEEEIANNPESDLTRVLQGKTAGVQITTQSGMSGSSNKIIIRGMNTFSGNNNALYVVDGVPYSNDTNAAGDFVSGNMGTSRSFDIDPNNIENIDVLKGLAATTLYGTEGRNGVILITTKTGSGKSLNSKQEVQISSSYFFNKVAALPDYQDSYGGGFDQAFGWFYSNWGPGFYQNGLGGWGNDAAFDENGTLPHPYATSDFLSTNYPEYQTQFFDANGDPLRYDWKPRNSVEDFFRTGGTATASVNVRGRSEDNKLTYGMAFSHLNDKGFLPGNEVTRNNLTVSGSAKLSNKFTAKGSMTYTKTNMKQPPVAFSNGSSAVATSIYGDLLYTPRNVDILALPFELPDGASVYYRQDNAIQHPLWTLKNAKFSQKVFRINGYGSLKYDFNEHLNLYYQGSVDQYSEDNVNRQNRGGVSGNAAIDTGFYDTWNNNNLIMDHNLVFSGNNYTLFNDNLNVSFLMGATSRSTSYNRIGVASSGQQVFDFFDHNGFSNYSPIEFHQERNVVGLYGSASFDHDNWIFLNVSGRNDWVSNANDNSLFYPSISGSFIPTELWGGMKSDNGFNYLKLRVGYGTSANFSTGYPTVTNVNLNTVAWQDNDGNTITSNSTSSFIGNEAIKPELFAETEFGLEARLFKRIDLDFSYYTRTTNDLIVISPIPASTGALRTTTNIGQIDSDGIEVDLGIDILKKADGFNWNFNVNYTQYESEVVDLGGESDLIIYEGFTNLGNGARIGYPLGAMFGSRVARDEDGNLLVDAAGNYIAESADEDGLLPFIGDPNPDFVMYYTNTFSYKGLSLGVTVNHTSGGDMYSQTISTLLGRGLTTDTEDRLSTYILPGISQTTGQPNDIQINNSDYYFGNIFAGPADELSVYDASVIRLHEVSLTYSFSKKLLEKTPFGSASIKFSGNNLWYDAYNMPEGINFDPNVTALGAGNGQGFEFLTGPSSKRYGLSVNLTF